MEIKNDGELKEIQKLETQELNQVTYFPFNKKYYSLKNKYVY